MVYIRIFPLMKCIDMDQSLHFFTNILDFEKDGRWPLAGSPSLSQIHRDNIHIQLSTHSGDGIAGNVATIIVEDVDELFKKYVSRGLDIANKSNSPVHQGPIDQTWGWREFYVADPSCNTLRFVQKL